MVAKISVGSSLYGAIAYNGEKINEAQGRLLTTNRIYNDGSGTVDIGKAMEGFLTFLPPQMKIEKPVVHISLNPHPEDVLTDIELQNIAREYLEKLGFGNQPYLVFKHEDIDRHHLHIVTVNVDENGKRLNRDFLYRRSDRIRRELEQKYGLHPAERKNQRLDNPLRKVAASAGDVKKQVGNTVKALNGQYRFQTMGEYRALLSLYNMTVEEARGNVRGREYHGLVYSVTDDKGNKVGNPFKSSLFGKSAGYEAVQKKFVRSKSEIKERIRKYLTQTPRTSLARAVSRWHRPGQPLPYRRKKPPLRKKALSCRRKRLLLTTETRKPSHARHKYRRTNSMKPSRASRPRNWSTEKMNRRMKNQTKSRLREVASRILTWQYTPYGRNHHPMRKCDTPERS
jgi:hypothetical protein